MYGASKVWRQMNREDVEVDRRTVDRLKSLQGIEGAKRRRSCRTISDTGAERPADLVRRQFVATRPSQLWMADFTYLATLSGFVYVAVVTDAYRPGARCPGAGALGQERRRRGYPSQRRGSQYLLICYTERLAESGVASSVGSRGDSYDNALAETINGLCKTEVIYERGRPWRKVDDVEYTTLEWVDWFNDRLLLEPIGSSPPAELEMAYCRQLEESATAARLKQKSLGDTRGDSLQDW